MQRIGFSHDQYVKLQSEHIRQRIDSFGGKLYLEFGGKLFDDYHASRVLPGFQPDSKMQMLRSLSDQVEIIIVINGATSASPTTRTCCGSSTSSGISACTWEAWSSPATPGSGLR